LGKYTKGCRGRCCIHCLLWFIAIVCMIEPARAESYLDMSLEELMKVEIISSGSLTRSTARTTPSTITTISKEDIQKSGARSLNELLDIYVPNLEMIRHHWESNHLGMRGIVNDREESYLFVVNGRVMNEKTHYGVLSERDLPMLTDINRINVVRGPGSATYGAGAMSMVIDILTDNAETFQGTEITARVGGAEEFYSTDQAWRETQERGGTFLLFWCRQISRCRSEGLSTGLWSELQGFLGETGQWRKTLRPVYKP
jgi:outer membrane receptor for ferrienterochelin and colicin